MRALSRSEGWMASRVSELSKTNNSRSPLFRVERIAREGKTLVVWVSSWIYVWRWKPDK